MARSDVAHARSVQEVRQVESLLGSLDDELAGRPIDSRDVR